MLSWTDIVQKYIIQYSDKIRQATRPLRNQFHVEYFTYHQVDIRGKYTVLVDRPDWAEHYVDEKFYLDDPYLRHPKLFKSGFYHYETFGAEDPVQRILKDGKQIFNLDEGLFLIQKKQDASVEFFGFCGNKANCNLSQLARNHAGLLKAYASYFKAELSSPLLQMEEEASSLLELKGRHYHASIPKQADIDAEAIFAFLKSIGKEKEVEKIGRLSQRERQCMQLLLKGQSAKEMGLKLQLSRRTIESYFEHIKDKLSCTTKQELFGLAETFEELGLLP